MSEHEFRAWFDRYGPPPADASWRLDPIQAVHAVREAPPKKARRFRWAVAAVFVAALAALGYVLQRPAVPGPAALTTPIPLPAKSVSLGLTVIGDAPTLHLLGARGTPGAPIASHRVVRGEWSWPRLESMSRRAPHVAYVVNGVPFGLVVRGAATYLILPADSPRPVVQNLSAGRAVLTAVDTGHGSIAYRFPGRAAGARITVGGQRLTILWHISGPATPRLGPGIPPEILNPAVDLGNAATGVPGTYAAPPVPGQAAGLIPDGVIWEQQGSAGVFWLLPPSGPPIPILRASPEHGASGPGAAITMNASDPVTNAVIFQDLDLQAATVPVYWWDVADGTVRTLWTNNAVPPGFDAPPFLFAPLARGWTDGFGKVQSISYATGRILTLAPAPRHAPPVLATGGDLWGTTMVGLPVHRPPVSKVPVVFNWRTGTETPVPASVFRFVPASMILQDTGSVVDLPGWGLTGDSIPGLGQGAKVLALASLDGKHHVQEAVAAGETFLAGRTFILRIRQRAIAVATVTAHDTVIWRTIGHGVPQVPDPGTSAIWVAGGRTHVYTP